MAEAVLTSLEERERLFRRAVAISVGAHLVLLLFAVVSPFPRSRSVTLPGVMNVSLVAAAPSAPSAAKAAPKKPAAPPPKPQAKPVEPKPAPPPPPKPEVKADKKLLPKEAVREPKPEPPKPKPAVAPPKPEEPLAYEDALDALREEAGEEEEAGDAPDPALLASVRPGPKAGPAGGGPGEPVDPEVAAWMRRVKIHVTRNWVLQPGFKRQAIQAVVEVTLDATGNVLEIDVTDGSGNPYYDQSVVRAIEKASPLPPPPESGEWPMLFSPQDAL